MPNTSQLEALKRMRRIAGGLLLIMTIIFLLSSYSFKHFNYGPYSWITYIRAFAEAAMVGAIADWFAVTALFRHPLGLPIPHTAIIPMKKDVIGASLGAFVENNFLTQEVLNEKLKDLKVTERLEEWLSKPENSALVAENIASFIPTILNALDDDDVRNFIEKKVLNKVTGQDVALLGGNILEVLISNKKHELIFNELTKILSNLFDENKDYLRKQIKREMPLFLRIAGADNTLSKRIEEVVDKTFDDINRNSNHPIRKRFNEAMIKFIEDLQTSENYHAKIEDIKNELFANPIVQHYFDNVWADLKGYILENITQQDSPLREQIQKTVYNTFSSLINDETLRQKISTWVYETALNLASRYRHEIGGIIAGTIQKWDKETLTEKLELQVGKDLQYIRISGTLVGGTVGFVLHLISHILNLIPIKT